MKLLVVREHFADGIRTDLSSWVFLIMPTEDIPFGLARILNKTSHAKFVMTESCDTLIKVSEELCVPHVRLNGKAVTDRCEKPFGMGDVLQVNYTYTGDHLISRDTVVIIPESVPHQYRA